MKTAAAILLMLIALIGPAYAQDTGTITGVVTSLGSHAVPDATVTLYDADGNFMAVPDNPQSTSNGINQNAGVYTFYDVPPGIYNVTAEKGGSQFFAIVNLSEGTATANVVLPEYEETAPAYSVPTSTPQPPKQFYTFVPIRVKKSPGQNTSSRNVPSWAAAAGAAGALLLFTRRKPD